MGNESRQTSEGAGSKPDKESIILLSGTVITEMKRCGRPNCRCSSGQLHGPYHYLYYRERGKLHKQYVKPGRLPAVQRGIDARRTLAIERRTARLQLRLLVRALREVDLW